MKLTLDRIVEAGMAAFAEHGYAGLSMRQVAERLDVHAGSLYYHVRNKEQLLALLADRVAGEAYAAGTAALDRLPADAGWARRIEAQMGAMRRTLRERAGAPLLLAASPTMLAPGALGQRERLLVTLTDAGVPAAHRSVAADLLLSHVTGFVLQEQSESVLPPAADASVLADLAARFPMAMSGSRDLTQDETFDRGVRMICTAIATLLPPRDTDLPR